MSMSRLSYGSTPMTTELMYQTVKERLEKFAELTPDKEACVFYDLEGNRSSIKCIDLLRKSRLFAKGLMVLGITLDDIVAVSLPNCLEWMVCVFGIQLIGAIPLLFMFCRRDGSDIADVLANIERCRAMLFDPGNDDINLDISSRFINEFSEGGLVKSKVFPSLQYLILSHRVNHEQFTLTIQDIIDLGETNSTMTLPDLDPDGAAVIFLSSGSTGIPKPVVHTHLNLLECGKQMSNILDLEESGVYYNGSLFTWSAAYPFIFLYKGTTRVTCSNILMVKGVEKLIDTITKAVSNEECTAAIIGASAILNMASNDQRNYSWAKTLRTVACLGLPIPSRCAKILDKFGKYFLNIYGCTEVAAIAAARITKENANVDYNVGFPLPGIEMKIVDDNGRIVPVNTDGEIYTRNYVKFLGYHDKAATNKVFTCTGWYKTNDIGRMLEDGSFKVCGRKSDLINVGENLVPLVYLERIMLKHPGVREVVVVPVADDEMFQQPCACVITTETESLLECELRELFKREFTLQTDFLLNVPKYFLFFKKFPKTPLQELSRVTLTMMANERIKAQREK